MGLVCRRLGDLSVAFFLCFLGVIFFAIVIGFFPGVGTAPDLGNHFLLRQKVIKNRFLIPTAELPSRLRRSGQTAAVSQSFCGGRYFALLVPLTSFLVRSWFLLAAYFGFLLFIE